MDSSPIWTRLEPHARDNQITPGLDAAIHDPLWLLARQWQLLEFCGENAGTPVLAQVEMTCAPITRYMANPGGKLPSAPDITGEDYDGTVPLEVLIEREFIQREPICVKKEENGSNKEILQQVQHMRYAAEAGVHFVRVLNRRGAGAFRSKILERFPLLPTKGETSLLEQLSDWDTLRFLGVMAGRVPDGVLLRSIFRIVFEGGSLDKLIDPYRSRVKSGVDVWRALSGSDQSALRPTVDEWLVWHGGLLSEPKEPGRPAWVPQRLEYQALISASTPQGEVVLNTSEYADGHLDWYAFNVLPAGSLSLDAKPTDKTTIKTTPIPPGVIPSQIAFAGMPAARYWEFEDANVDFGVTAAGVQQLAHLLLLEFGLVSGDDWFVIPVEVPVGTLCFTRKLSVFDNFVDNVGEASIAINSTRVVDTGPNQPPGLLPWGLFHLSLEPTPGTSTAPIGPEALFVPPTLGRSLQSRAIEEVLFTRDEMANMAWAVERTIESALGRPFSRSEAFFRERKQRPLPSAAPQGSQTRLYRLASELPPHWVPMLPVPIVEGRADLLGLKPGRQGQGHILAELWKVANPDPPQGTEPPREGMPLYGEEVPREGARISRAYQYARWTNGKSYLWIGRRNEVGRGEGSSGLVFDQLVPPSEASNP